MNGSNLGVPTSQSTTATTSQPPVRPQLATGNLAGRILAPARAQAAAPTLTPVNQAPTPLHQGIQLRSVPAQRQLPVQQSPGPPQPQPSSQPPVPRGAQPQPQPQGWPAQGPALPPPLDASSLPDPQDLDIPDHLPPPPSSGGADVGGQVAPRKDKPPVPSKGAKPPLPPQFQAPKGPQPPRSSGQPSLFGPPPTSTAAPQSTATSSTSTSAPASKPSWQAPSSKGVDRRIVSGDIVLHATPAAKAALRPQAPSGSRPLLDGALRDLQKNLALIMNDGGKGAREMIASHDKMISELQRFKIDYNSHQGQKLDPVMAPKLKLWESQLKSVLSIIESYRRPNGSLPSGFVTPLLETGKQLQIVTSLQQAIGKTGTHQPTVGELAHLRDHGLPPAALDDLAVYRKPIKWAPLGSGNVNSVCLATYQTADGPVNKVFKPVLPSDDSFASDKAAKIGIDRRDPRYAIRNVATSLRAERLGLGHLMPKVNFASGPNGELGIAMDHVQGSKSPANHGDGVYALTEDDVRRLKTAQDQLGTGGPNHAAAEEDYLRQVASEKGVDIDGQGQWVYRPRIADQFKPKEDPKLLEQMVDLETLMKSAGQSDCNPGNYLYNFDTHTLKAIDTDFGFGKNYVDPNAPLYLTSTTGAQPLVKDTTATAVIKLVDEYYKKGGAAEEMRNLGFSKEEIDADFIRNKNLAQHYLNLMEVGATFTSSDFQSRTGEIFEKLTKGDDPTKQDDGTRSIVAQLEETKRLQRQQMAEHRPEKVFSEYREKEKS
jgi:hypothetical protein